MIVQCCNCKKYRHSGLWVTSEKIMSRLQTSKEKVTHTYCPACYSKVIAELSLLETSVAVNS